MAEIMNKNIYVKAPLESIDYNIDDFLGNSFQYKIGDEWHYDTSVSLPNDDLKISRVLTVEEVSKLELNSEFKWILVEKI
jgi:hypothetical protein